jgi:hypothetical protein
MDTHRDPTTGNRPGRHTGDHLASAAGSHVEVGRLLAHLEQRLDELDRLHREIAEDAHALAHETAPGLARCTRSVPPRPSWG